MITEEHYRKLAQHLSRTLGVTVIDKSMAFEMKLLGAVMELVHTATRGLFGMTSETWLNRFATTLGTLIYVPGHWTPAQKLVVLVHEAQHAVQFTRPSGTGLPPHLGMAWLYVTQSEARVRCEADAERASLEFQYALFGRLPTDDALAVALHFEGTAYQFSSDNLLLFQDLVEVVLTTLDRTAGVASTDAGRAAIAWLNAEAPELRGAGLS